MRRMLLLLSVFASLAWTGEAMATEVLAQDDQGRTIRFDVRVEGVDAEWYAALLEIYRDMYPQLSGLMRRLSAFTKAVPPG